MTDDRHTGFWGKWRRCRATVHVIEFIHSGEQGLTGLLQSQLQQEQPQQRGCRKAGSCWLTALLVLLVLPPLLLVPLLAYPGSRRFPTSLLTGTALRERVFIVAMGLGSPGGEALEQRQDGNRSEGASLEGAQGRGHYTQQPAKAAGIAGRFLGEEQLQLEESKHKCLEASRNADRVCNFQSLVLYEGRLYYISDDPTIDIPIVDTHYLSLATKVQKDTAALFGPGLGLEIASRGQLPWGNSTVLVEKQLDNVYLWNARMGYNLGHALGEEVINMHNSMCKYLGSCHYAQRSQQHVVLLDKGRMLSAVREVIARCMSSSSPLTLPEWSASVSPKGIVILRNVTVGVGPDCRAMGDCRPEDPTDKRQKRMDPGVMELWRRRIGNCMGYNASAPASLRPLRILAVDRRSGKGRHITNIGQVEKAIREMLPEAHVRVVYLEDYPIQQQIQMVNNASLLLMMHGAALGLWPFMPRNAVGIHGVAELPPDGDKAQNWAKRMVNDLVVANITTVPLTNQRGDLVRFYMDRLRKNPGYKRLSKAKQQALTKEGKCPESIHAICRKLFYLRMADLEMDLGQVKQVIAQALKELLLKYPLEETAGLSWASAAA